MIRAFLLQLQFFTRIPVPLKIDFDDRTFAMGAMLAPVTGLIIGGVMTGVYCLVALSGRLIPAVVLAVIAEIVITGGLHLDGLADTFDGIFSNRPKEKIFEIMKDSRIGTNGTLVLISILLLKISVLVSLSDSKIISCILVFPVISRMNLVWAAGISGYAGKAGGMGEGIVKYTGKKEIVVSTVLSLIISVVFFKANAVLLVAGAVVFVFLFTLYVSKKIGGITGDIIGAVIELTEVIVLLLLLIIT